MKKLNVIFFTFLALSCKAFAADWSGAEIMFATGGSYNLSDRVSLKGDVVYFGKPETDTHMFFFYTGPGFKATEWLYLSPKIGMNYNRPTGDDPKRNLDFLLASLWIDIVPIRSDEYGTLWLFIAGDIYIHPDEQIFWGYYSFTYTPPVVKCLEFGPHMEQVNDKIFPGGLVELKFKFDPLMMKIGAHYFGGFQEGAEGHSVRGVLKLFFSN